MTAQAEARAKSVSVRASARRAYASLAAAQERAKLAREAFDLAADLEKRAQSRVQTGLAPQLEAVQAGLARKRAARERDDRAAALTGAREELGRVIAAPEASTLETADANFPAPEVLPLDQLLARSERHPEVESFLRQKDAALARASRERAAIRPLPDLSLEFEKLNGPPASIGLRWGIAFDLPVLTWNSGRVNEALALADAAGSLARGALSRQLSGVRSAHAKLEAANARAKSFAAEIVPAAQDLVKMARDAWELGRTPLTAVLQAQTDLTSVRADASDAALAAQQALADLEEAAGESL
jgi:cobalt-zinc-cadmium efflux system outer membrane protein